MCNTTLTNDHNIIQEKVSIAPEANSIKPKVIKKTFKSRDLQKKFTQNLHENKKYLFQKLVISANVQSGYLYLLKLLKNKSNLDTTTKKLSLIEVIHELTLRCTNETDPLQLTTLQKNFLLEKTFRFQSRLFIFYSIFLGNDRPFTPPSVFGTEVPLDKNALEHLFCNLVDIILEKTIEGVSNHGLPFTPKLLQHIKAQVLYQANDLGRQIIFFLRSLFPLKVTPEMYNLRINNACPNDAGIILFLLQVYVFQNPAYSKLTCDIHMTKQLNDYFNEISFLLSYAFFYELMPLTDVGHCINSNFWFGSIEKVAVPLSKTTFNTLIRILESFMINLYSHVIDCSLGSVQYIFPIVYDFGDPINKKGTDIQQVAQTNSRYIAPIPILERKP